ncbi:hypothetical protein U1Q18_027869, partial [Sarracenia purpurea var. burkii]
IKIAASLDDFVLKSRKCVSRRTGTSIPLYRSSLNVNEIEVTVGEKLKEESLEVEDKDAPSSLLVRSSPVSKAESEYEEEADDGDV